MLSETLNACSKKAICKLHNIISRIIDPKLGPISRDYDAVLDPRPQADSPLYDGAITLADPFFENNKYSGAFDKWNWMHGWTGLSVSGYLILDEGQQTINIPNPELSIKLHSYNFEIEFDAIEDVSYQLLESNNLSDWTVVDNPAGGVYSNGKIKIITTSSTNNNFYKVIAE